MPRQDWVVNLSKLRPSCRASFSEQHFVTERVTLWCHPRPEAVASAASGRVRWSAGAGTSPHIFCALSPTCLRPAANVPLNRPQYRASSHCWWHSTSTDRGVLPCHHWRGRSRSLTPVGVDLVIICDAMGVPGGEAHSDYDCPGRSLVGNKLKQRPQKAGVSLRAAPGPAASSAGPARGAGKCGCAPIRSAHRPHGAQNSSKIYKSYGTKRPLVVHVGTPVNRESQYRTPRAPAALVVSSHRPAAREGSQIPSKDWTETAQCAPPGCCSVMVCRWRPFCLLLRSRHVQEALGARPTLHAGWQPNQAWQLVSSD